jgi:riboflavin synthase
MFTGLIEDLGILRELRTGGESAEVTVATAIPLAELSAGDSIAVNGVCLTVTGFLGGNAFRADVSPETLKRTALGEKQPGDRVNLERALRLSDRLGGHLVSGHVDAVAIVEERRRERNAEHFTLRLADPVQRFVVEKGSVAVDGISLTVNRVEPDRFTVTVIPHTLAATTLQEAGTGTRVNIETDLLGKYLERLMRRETDTGKPALDLEFLAKHGFL